MQWIMEKKGIVHLFHYIDDFITVGAPESSECADNAALMHDTCVMLGLPVEAEKDEGPATSITFLGIEIDSVATEIRLPQEKLARLKSELYSCRGRKACRKRDLLSLIGSLAHACKAVRAGRSFLPRLIDLSTVVSNLNHFVRLSREAKSDIEWWYQFSERWNGISTMHMANGNSVQASVSMTSDASGSWGCGAYSGPHWFMLQWVGPITECYITAKEMVPIVIAAATWGTGGERRSGPGVTMQQ